MIPRYFVVITAPNKQQLVSLQKLELDLFQSTVKTLDKNEFSIEGINHIRGCKQTCRKGIQSAYEEAVAK
jgi:hypothetical protein